MNSIGNILNERIMLLDGAMGTMIQRLALDEATFRGNIFTQHDYLLQGCYDVLNLTAPHIVEKIHSQYLDAGADIIKTNTFNANAVSLGEYHLHEYVTEINHAAVSIARRVANQYTTLTPNRPRLVAGTVGPTCKSCSVASSYNIELYNLLVESYTEQITALIAAGVDILLIETICDLHNALAALQAAEQAMAHTGCNLPIMLSITTTEGGTLLSGHSLDEFVAALSNAPILSVGINCSYGAKAILPPLRTLSRTAPYYISAHPNAGLPDEIGKYKQQATDMVEIMKAYIEEGLVNIVGGCCGTTPELTALLSHAIEEASPRIIPNKQ